LFKRILAIGAHRDDIEIGAGALLNKIIVENKFEFMGILHLSPPPDEGADNDDETLNSAVTLGINLLDSRLRFHLHNFKAREFWSRRQEVLDLLWSFRKYSPDTILVHNTQDTHQDHEIVNKEAIRAFYDCSILGYESPSIIINSKNILYTKINDCNIQAKINALHAYETQSYRRGINLDAILSLATLRGNQCGLGLAEAYETIKIILK
jgi:LmbE family N-acetylglucosaminyl deacetylase